MSSASIKIEILVIGMIGLVSLIGLCIGLGLVSSDELLALMDVNAGAVAVLVAVVTAMAYQVGWTVNIMSHELVARQNRLWWLSETRIERELLFDPEVDVSRLSRKDVDERYRQIEADAYCGGSAAMVSDLAIERGIVRIGRCGVLNFSVLAVAVLAYSIRSLFGGGWAFSPLLFLLLFAACLMTFLSYHLWRISLRRYLSRMLIVSRWRAPDRDVGSANA